MMRTQTNKIAEYPEPFIDDLPEGWMRVKLPQVSNINMGQSPPGSSYNDRGEGLPFFQGKAEFGERYPKVRIWCTEPKKIGNLGDVLISIRAPIGPTNVADRKCIVGRGLAALTPLGGIPTEFLLFALRLIEPELSISGTGSTFTAINRKALEEIEIDVPPLAEQKRVVAKVEELLTRVNATKERLAKVKEILKRFRQSVLAAACSGSLTTDWRGQNANIPDAKNLLSLILAERDRSQKKRRTRESANSKSLGEFNQLPQTDRLEFEELPDKWVLASGAHLFAWSSGKFLPKKRQNEGPYPVFGGNGISGHHSEYIVHFPTLVIGRVGALCGNVYITPGKAWVTDNAIYAAHVPRKLNLRYVYMVFTHANLNANAGGSGQPFVNQTVLNEIPVPLPPLAEQDEIARRVEALFKLSDTIEKRVAAVTVHAEKLIQAILAKAFHGGLVPTEAELAKQDGRSYEPASALLAKIKVQRKYVKPRRKHRVSKSKGINYKLQFRKV